MVAPFGFVRHADEQGRTSATPGAPARSPSLFKEQLTWFAEDVIPAFNEIGIKDCSDMKENVKRVFYVRQVAHPCYLDIIAQRPEIRIDKL